MCVSVCIYVALACMWVCEREREKNIMAVTLIFAFLLLLFLGSLVSIIAFFPSLFALFLAIFLLHGFGGSFLRLLFFLLGSTYDPQVSFPPFATNFLFSIFTCIKTIRLESHLESFRLLPLLQRSVADFLCNLGRVGNVNDLVDDQSMCKLLGCYIVCVSNKQKGILGARDPSAFYLVRAFHPFEVTDMSDPPFHAHSLLHRRRRRCYCRYRLCSPARGRTHTCPCRHWSFQALSCQNLLKELEVWRLRACRQGTNIYPQFLHLISQPFPQSTICLRCQVLE